MIEVKNLNLTHNSSPILQNISFTLPPNHSLGISGKSGSGKTMLLKSLIALTSSTLTLKAQTLLIDSYPVLSLNQNQLRDLRSKACMIFQDVYGSFYPLLDIGSYFDIVIKTHLKLNKKERKEKAFYFLESLGLDNPDLIWHSYIHQLSGGMARRVQIALALCCDAKYLLCDEITSSLDEKNIEKLFMILEQFKTTPQWIFVTHDLKLLKYFCDEIILLENGKIIEQQNKNQFFCSPQSLYGQTLLEYQ